MKPSHLLVLFTLLLFATEARAISVSISQTGTAGNSCTRTLTAAIGSGSGNYTYTWSIISPAQSWPTTNNVSSVNLALSQTVDVNVTVHDITLNQYASATVTVNRILTGSFNTFIPNLITPNGDGYNDNWIVTASDKTLSPINAFTYTLTIKNASNVQVFAASNTITASCLGIIGGDINWNARLNGTGSIVATGSYTYALYLQNCSNTTTSTGTLAVMY